MDSILYRFTLDATVPIADTEQTLLLAVLAAEGLFGEARVRLDLVYHIDKARRVIAIDAGNDVGHAVARMFTALLLYEIGGERFGVHRTPKTQAHSTAA